MKTCRVCRQSKPLEEFSRLKASKDGRNSDCKACERKRVLRWRVKAVAAGRVAPIKRKRKTCSKCKVEKSIEEFSLGNPFKGDGRSAWCKTCCAEHIRRRYRSDPEFRAKQKAWSKANPDKRREYERRYRLKKKGAS